MKEVKYISDGTSIYEIIGKPCPSGPPGPKGDYCNSAIDVTKLGISSDTDITEQINNLLKEGYNKFYFPAGTYIMSYLEFSNQSLEIYGESSTTTIIKRPDGYSTDKTHRRYAFMINNLTTTQVNKHHFIMKDITIDGNSQNANIVTYEDSKGRQALNYLYSNIEIKCLASVYIKDCIIKNSIGNGAGIDGNGRTDVINTDFIYNGHCGLDWAARNGLDIKAIYFDYENGKAVPKIPTGNVAAYVEGCNFVDTDDMSMSISPMDQIVVKNCNFNGCGYSDFELWSDYEQTGIWFRDTHLTISNCNLKNNLRLGPRSSVTDKLPYILTVEDCTVDGIDIDKGAFNLNSKNAALRFKLKDTKFTNVKRAIVLTSGDYVKIEHSTFDCTELAIQVQNITDKVILDDNEITAKKYGIYCYNYNNDIHAHRNRITITENSDYETFDQRAIFIFNPIASPKNNERYDIKDNSITGYNGIYIADAIVTKFASIENNKFTATENLTISHTSPTVLIATGNLLLKTEAFNTATPSYNKVSDNYFIGPNAEQTTTE